MTKLVSPKEPKQKYISWMGNVIRKTNEGTAKTSKSTKEGTIHKDTMESKD